MSTSSAGTEARQIYPEYERLCWIVVHGRGVIHTGHANKLVKILSTAGVVSGKESYYYMRYDDSPERDHIPHLFYAVLGNPTIDVVLHEEVEPVGQVFNAIVVLDSSMLIHQTSQRARLFDGAKKQAVLVVNTSLSNDQVIRLVKKHSLASEWNGKLVTIRASKYSKDIAYPLLGALSKALPEVGIDHLFGALDLLGQDKNKDVVRKAHDESEITEVNIPKEETSLSAKRASSQVQLPHATKGDWWDRETYRKYQMAAANADTYSSRIEAMPTWEALAPGLIEFGPNPGERNIGFKTSFSRSTRPVIDATKCTDCKLCHVYCPDGAIDFQTIKIDLDYCQGCGICAQICPIKAVEMVSELKSTEGLNEEEVSSVSDALREYGY